MNERQKFLIRQLVAELKRADGEPMDEVLLHAKLLPLFMPRLTKHELDEALTYAEAASCIRGTTAELRGTVWAITTKGRLAEL